MSDRDALEDVIVAYASAYDRYLRDVTWDDVMAALADHDRAVAARAWAEGQAAGLDEANRHFRLGQVGICTNPYVVTGPERVGKPWCASSE